MAASFPAAHANPPRLLIVPGLLDSGPSHWQSWLQSLHRGAVRVEQRHWDQPDLARWADCIASTLERAGPGPWMVAAHSFGCLALARCLAQQPHAAIVAALLVAPADPDKFGIAELLPAEALPMPATMVVSDTDPWMRASAAQRWARRWGCHVLNLGDAGHINVESGFGPLPMAQRWAQGVVQRCERARRFERATVAEWRFAI